MIKDFINDVTATFDLGLGMQHSVGFKLGSHYCCASILKYFSSQKEYSFKEKRVKTSEYVGRDDCIEEEENEKQNRVSQDERSESDHSMRIISKRNAFEQMTGFRRIIEELIKTVKETDRDGVYKAFYVAIPEGIFEEEKHFIKRVFKETVNEKNVLIMYVSEPCAASYYYHTYYNTNDTHEMNVIVYNLGYRSFDVSLVHIKNGKYEVKKTISDSGISGEAFDLIIKRLIWTKFEEKGNHELLPVNDPDRKRVYDEKIGLLMEKSEEVKMELNEKDEVIVSTTAFEDKEWYPSGPWPSVTITKNEVEKEMISMLNNSKNLVLKFLKECNDENKKINQIILAGGSCCHSLVKEYLKQHITKQNVIISGDKDSSMEYIGYGAALMGKCRDIEEIGNDEESLYNVLFCINKKDQERKKKVFSIGESLPSRHRYVISHSDYQEGSLDFFYYRQKDDDSSCELIEILELKNEQLKSGVQLEIDFILQKDHVLIIEHTLVSTRELLRRINIQL